MVSRILSIAVGVLFMFGCTSEPPVDVIYTEKAADVEKTVAKIGVEGMMCEIACGGKIRKELSEMNGVANASIEYSEGENVNYALVEYNPTQVNESELIRCINGISDGKLYSVAQMEVTSFLPSGNIHGTSNDDPVDMNGSQFEAPGITNILRAILKSVRG